MAHAILFPASVLLALVNHLVFNHFEPCHVVLAGLLVAAQPAALCYLLSTPTLGQAYIGFLTTLLLSIAAYRLSPLHPLASIPGPRLSFITKLSSIYTVYTGRQHLRLKSLHDEYGPIVRTGPNEISVIDVASIKDILGLPKSPFYTARIPAGGHGSILVTVGDEHTERRRRWTRGLSSAALKDYQDIMLTRTNQLIDALNTFMAKPVSFSSWMNYFSFDFMGDMAFGGGIEMMNLREDRFWRLLERYAMANVMICQTPWLYNTFLAAPFVSRYHHAMAHYSACKATRRLETIPERKDLWFHLMDEAGLESAKPSFSEVVAEAMLTIIAGSDTTSAAMCSLFYCLLMYRPCYERLQMEVDLVLPTTECAMGATASNMPYMAACINETLRLYPPIPSNGPRIVPTGCGAKMLGGFSIPEGTYVYVPPFALHRHPGHFSPSPDRFMPERWLKPLAPNNVLDMDAFIPFSYGPANCVGKRLALQELFSLTAVLMQKFDISFAEGFDFRRWPDGVKDFFVTTRPALQVVFTPRS